MNLRGFVKGVTHYQVGLCFQVTEALSAHYMQQQQSLGEMLNFNWFHIQHSSRTFSMALGERFTQDVVLATVPKVVLWNVLVAKPKFEHWDSQC